MKKILLGIFAVFMSLGLACGSCFLIERNVTAVSSEEETIEDDADKTVTASTSGYWKDDYSSSLSLDYDGRGYSIKIYTAKDLARFAKGVNNDWSESYIGKYKSATIKLMADIDLSAHYWTPIGSGSNPFQGTFDGNGHTISGLYISTTGMYDAEDKFGKVSGNFSFENSNYNVAIGLFGYTNGASISNFTLKSGRIYLYGDETTNRHGSFLTDDTFGHVGAAVGLLSGGYIANVTNKGVAIYYSQSIDDGFLWWDVPIFKSMNVGGLVGTMITTSSYCSGNQSNANITIDCPNGLHEIFDKLRVGGIAGYASMVYNCYSNSTISIEHSSGGSVAKSGYYAGLVGELGYSSSNSSSFLYFDGDIYINVSSKSDGSMVVGGIIGFVEGTISTSGTTITANTSPIYYATNYGAITVKNIYKTYVGGIVGGGLVKIYSCVNFGDLTLTSNSTDGDSSTSGYGGIIGWAAYSYIYWCANYGNVICSASNKASYGFGGIVGLCFYSNLVTECINHGKVQGGTNSQFVGGIVGCLTKFSVNNISFTPYISNCVNLGPVSGGTNVGQITGYSDSQDQVVKCYFRSDSSGTSWGIGNDSSTGSSGSYYVQSYCKTYDQLCEYKQYTNTTNWTTGSFNGYSSCNFSYGWERTNLVYDYYTSSERNTKGMTNQVLMIPSYALSYFSIGVYWNKRDGSYTSQTSNGEVATISIKTVKNSGESNEYVDWGKEKTSGSYLRGADYTIYNRYTALIKVGYATKSSKFTFNEINTESQGTGDTISSYMSGYTIYPKFTYSEIANNYSRLYFLFSSKSFSSISINYYADNSSSNSNTVGTVDLTYNNKSISSSNKVYYQDEIAYTITPQLGYKFVGLYRSRKTDSIAENTNTGVISGSYTYNCETTLYAYFARIEYSYEFYTYENGTALSGSIYSGSGTFKKDGSLTLSYGDGNYGYTYSVYIYYNNSDNKTLLTTTELNSSGKIVLDSATILGAKTQMTNIFGKPLPLYVYTGLYAVANSENLNVIEIDSFKLYVEREAIEYTINIHSMINSYKKSSTYQEVDEENCKTLIDSGTEWNSTQFAYFESDAEASTINVKAGNTFGVNYSNADKYGFNTANKVAVAESSTLPSSTIPNVTFGKNTSLATLLNHTKGSSKTIDLYFYYTLDTYALNIGATLTNSNNSTSNISGSLNITCTSDPNDSSSSAYKKTSYNSGISVKTQYYAPISLYLGSFTSDVNFLGWYLSDGKLLSLDKDYYFVNNPQVWENTDNRGVTVVAKFASYGSGNTVSATNGVYKISTANDLLWLSNQVAKGESFAGVLFTQTADIDMSGAVFNSIGTKTTPFKGVYNGNGFVISNLTVQNSSNGESYKNSLSGRGLFGYTDGATIKNLTIYSGKVSGYSDVGIVAGNAKNTTFKNVSNYNATINASTLTFYNIYGKSTTTYLTGEYDKTTGKFTTTADFATRQNFGGLVGYAENCSFYACSNSSEKLIENTNANISVKAGLVGKAENCDIEQCFSVSASGTTSLTDNDASDKIKDCYVGSTLLNASYVDGVLDSTIWVQIDSVNRLRVFYWG